MPTDFHAIVLAAGQGTRMKSALPKVLHSVLGRPMVDYPIRAVRELGAKSIVLVVGHQAERVEHAFQGAPDLLFALQAEQKGTGHAVLCAQEHLPSSGTVLILTGDIPLVRSEVLKEFLHAHEASGAKVTVLAADYANPHGYGRILVDGEGKVDAIVEEKDATQEQRAVRLCNTGLYACDIAVLFQLLERLNPENAQNEYYLTDIIRLARQDGLPVGFYLAPNNLDFLGVNDRLQLTEATAILQDRICKAHLLNGVGMHDSKRVYIEPDVQIAPDAWLEANVHLAGNSVIGSQVHIEMGVRIENSRIEAHSHIKAHSVIEDSLVGTGCTIGPLAHLRPGTVLEQGVHVGNFVEIKKTRLGRGSKANHLTYLGDADIGSGVNIGAGTITCNYDGVNKHRTVIGDGVFVGSDTQFVAPVKVGDRAIIGAGTTVTQDVPADALAVSRSPQKNLPDYRQRYDRNRKP